MKQKSLKVADKNMVQGKHMCKGPRARKYLKVYTVSLPMTN